MKERCGAITFNTRRIPKFIHYDSNLAVVLFGEDVAAVQFSNVGGAVWNQACLSRVVLPDPRKPVRRVIGHCWIAERVFSASLSCTDGSSAFATGGTLTRRGLPSRSTSFSESMSGVYINGIYLHILIFEVAVLIHVGLNTTLLYNRKSACRSFFSALSPFKQCHQLSSPSRRVHVLACLQYCGCFTPACIPSRTLCI